MSVEVRPAREEDRAPIEALLSGERLPLDGVAEHLASFVVAEEGGRVVGAAGLELHERDALLRSVVVAPAAKGQGLGTTLSRHLVDTARARGVRAVYLLTTTAPDFFQRLGFERVERADAARDVGSSRELQGACPATAVVMRLALAGRS